MIKKHAIEMNKILSGNHNIDCSGCCRLCRMEYVCDSSVDCYNCLLKNECTKKEKERSNCMQDIYKPCCDCYMALKECPCPHRGYCLADDNGGICIHSHLSENNFEMKKKREIECDFHGKIKWKYHLICRSCKRVFDRKKSNFIVEKRNNTCYCGEKFAPVKSLKEDPEKKEIFSAAPICPECYKREIKKKRGFE